MKIDQVITDAVLALYSDPELAEHLYLKGGSALRLFDDLAARLSVDADFATDTTVEDPNTFFGKIKQSLEERFQPVGFDILDFEYKRKPRTQRLDRPEWWGGWCCEFKLCDHKFRCEPLETRRRNALIPEGGNASKIPLDFSDHEFCGLSRWKEINGISIHGYTRELLVLEKLRAICQQHPSYPYRLNKNRARDFYDIDQLIQDIDELFIKTCRQNIDKVFSAKEVPLDLLSDLWSEAFTDEFARGFDQVKDTIHGQAHEFETYLESVRFLVLDLLPNIRKA